MSLTRKVHDFAKGVGLNQFVRTWRRFWQIPGRARLLVLEAAACLIVTRVALRLAGFRRWRRVIEWLTRRDALPDRRLTDSGIAVAQEIAKWHAAAAWRLPLSTNCLERSLTLWWRLRRRGIPAELCIGGRKENGCFEAHAWTEAGGVILDDASDSPDDFQPFEQRFGAAGTHLS